MGTDGTGTAEFTLFGRVARQVVGKPVVSLIRSVSKNQYGPSNSELDHILPELAALVSQKFTFSVSLSSKNLTQRNVSFQVSSIVTFFGKQASIPQPYNPSFDGETRSSAIVASSESQRNIPEDSNAPKKVRFDRKVSLNKSHMAKIAYLLFACYDCLGCLL